MKFNAQIAGATHEFEWTGELPSGDNTKMDFAMEIPFGTYNGTLNIVEANGQPFETSMAFEAESLEWAEVEFEEETTSIKVYVIQDQWGEQITWDIINSAGEIVAAGGPYQHLVGSGSTQANVENVNDIPTDECYLFRIYDSNNNGICCNYGNGYYYIKDAHGNKIFEGDGEFGSMAAHLFSLKRDHTSVDENDATALNIYPNPANNKIYVSGENIGVVEIYNSLGQMLLTVEGTDNTTVDVASFENGIYVVRVIANDGIVTTKKVTIAH